MLAEETLGDACCMFPYLLARGQYDPDLQPHDLHRFWPDLDPMEATPYIQMY